MENDDFNERPIKNEKKDSISYIRKLIIDAKKNGNINDIPKLEKIIRIINDKKYGLIWEEHSEKVEEEMKTKIPVFTEEKNKEINDDKESQNFNFLLEGDNLHSLHLLEKTHTGKIDVIYIDPPYNTGNKDFKYNDVFVDDNDSFKHSKWLSFMERRLKVAKKLLSKDGVIFISIDNREGYQLKLLLDEIFGESNMAADLHIETSAVAGPRRYAAVNGSVVKTTEFVFAYTNGNNSIIKRPLYDSVQGYDTHYSRFQKEDGNLVPLISKIKEEPELVKQFEMANMKISMKNLNELIISNKVIKNWIYRDDISKKIFRDGDKVNNLSDNELSNVFAKRVTKVNDKYMTLNSKGKPIRLFRYYDRIGYADDYSKTYGERTLRGNLWKGFSADGGNLSSEGGVTFKNGKKPIRLIKQLIECSTDKSNKNITVLDFFAGSGTTGEAVMELNNENKGNYSFILATNDEVIETTYKRMKNVSSKYPLNLKYFKTNFVNKEDFPGSSLEDELMKYIGPLVELEFGVDINNPKVQIILNEDQLDNLLKNNKIVKDSILFMNPDVFLDDTQIKMLFELNVITHDIPNYFFGKDMWS